ncbi:TPA: hypothetical protein JG839_004147 [Enterobacter hormaechei subsp. steigerwaltii]|nr:hypothetical protein [Enterobacter hormaechei subsp. steigerwaltii]
MGGEKIETVSNVIRKSYGHFLKDDSLLTAIYVKHLDREFDTEYHSEEELHLVDIKTYLMVNTLRCKSESF